MFCLLSRNCACVAHPVPAKKDQADKKIKGYVFHGSFLSLKHSSRRRSGGAIL